MQDIADSDTLAVHDGPASKKKRKGGAEECGDRHKPGRKREKGRAHKKEKTLKGESARDGEDGRDKEDEIPSVSSSSSSSSSSDVVMDKSFWDSLEEKIEEELKDLEEESNDDLAALNDGSSLVSSRKKRLEKLMGSVNALQGASNTIDYSNVGSQMHFHASTGQKDVLEELVRQSPELIEHPSNDGRTILHVAATQGHTEIVSMLLDCGALIDAQNVNGLTPLMISAAKGEIKVLRLLLLRGMAFLFSLFCSSVSHISSALCCRSPSRDADNRRRIHGSPSLCL